MILTNGSYTSHTFSIIPEHDRAWLTRQLDKEDDFFEGHTGNALLVPTRDLPFAYRHDFPTCLGTCVDGYTSVLDVFFWQFARPWMGLAGEKKAFLAAPEQHVSGALEASIFLLNSPERLVGVLPEDCNIHWRGFSSTQQLPDLPEQSSLTLLLALLQHAGVVIPEPEANDHQLSLCTRFSLPVRSTRASLVCSSQSATTFVWFLPLANEHWAARLGTVFACSYGIDYDE